MSKRHKRYFLRDKESKLLLSRASERLRVDLSKIFKSKASFEVVETDSEKIILVEGRPLLVETGEDLFPTLMFNELLAIAPKVVVDMGAIPFVCKGANVMAPGIRRFEGKFSKGDLVFILDEKNRKAVAVGEILCDSEEAAKIDRGIVVRSVHFAGDRVWTHLKTL